MKNETRSFYEAAVERAVERVYDSLDEALDLGALARTAALSPLHFHRIFRGMLGETPLELHRRLRMERAAHQLASAVAPVTRIAFDAGYETHESFTRAFGEHYGVSPSAFRHHAAEARASCGRPPQLALAARSGLHFQLGRRAEPMLIVTQGEATMHVVVTQLPALRAAAVRHLGPYSRIHEAFQRLDELVRPAGLIRRDSEMLAIFHDDPDATPTATLRSDAALTVPEDAPLPSGLHELRIAAGRYACATHIGPYTSLGDIWARLMGSWLPASGYRASDEPSFEIYRNTPADVAPEELRTELYLRLA